MTKHIYKILAFFFLLHANAQELTLPTFTQYLADNPFVISPTFAGIGDHIKVRMNGLTQWVGVENAPNTQSLAADLRIAERSGVGFLIYNDKNGNTRQYGARLSFAHHLTIDRYDDHFLSFGVSYVFNQFRLNISDLVGDPSITDDRSTSNHNFDAGVLYRIKNFYLSASVGNILNKETDIFAINEPEELRNYYFHAGYKWRKNKNASFEIEPSVYMQLFESDGRSTTDFNIKFRWYDFQDYYYVGLSYRFLNDQIGEPLNVGPIVGLKKSNFYFGFSYQPILNNLENYSSGTYMVTLGVDLFQGISNCRCMY